MAVTGWRMGDGKLWIPNTVAHVRCPTLKIDEDWLIVECDWRRSAEGGTQTVMQLMRSRSRSLPRNRSRGIGLAVLCPRLALPIGSPRDSANLCVAQTEARLSGRPAVAGSG
jgi:hypothetical protein